jgi:Fuc2NAc and GlcNAc transferase
MTGALLLGVSFVGAANLEAILLWVARRAEWLAHPNERSSHVVATPTAGGVAIVLPLLAYLSALSWQNHPASLALFMAVALIALVSLWDDLRPLGRGIRLGAHAVAVVLVIWGQQAQIAAPGADLATVWDAAWPLWVLVVACACLLWHVNLFNFMDGIDGIAGVQCLLVCVGVQVLAGSMSSWSGELAWVTAGATLGFLLYNWPPAKIFMGDVGAATLGLVTGYVILDAFLTDNVPLVSALILLAVFWFDATYTLCVRMFGGQAYTEAHRSHLYQKLAARKGHRWTTTVFLLFGVLFLMPLAWLAADRPLASIPALVVAIAPLAYAARTLRAGEPDHDAL